MSDQVSRVERRWLQVRLVPWLAVVGPAAALVIAAGLTAPGVEMALRSVPEALASLLEFDWPRWLHNLADLLQIITPLVAILAWGTTRRKRR